MRRLSSGGARRRAPSTARGGRSSGCFVSCRAYGRWRSEYHSALTKLATTHTGFVGSCGMSPRADLFRLGQSYPPSQRERCPLASVLQSASTALSESAFAFRCAGERGTSARLQRHSFNRAKHTAKTATGETSQALFSAGKRKPPFARSKRVHRQRASVAERSNSPRASERARKKARLYNCTTRC